MTSGSARTAVFAGFIRLVMGVNLEQVDVAQLFQCRQYLLVGPSEVGQGLCERTILVTAMFDSMHAVHVCVQVGPRPGNRLGHNDSDPCGALGNASEIGKPSGGGLKLNRSSDRPEHNRFSPTGQARRFCRCPPLLGHTSGTMKLALLGPCGCGMVGGPPDAGFRAVWADIRDGCFSALITTGHMNRRDLHEKNGGADVRDQMAP
jgi:hypothetical protein